MTTTKIVYKTIGRDSSNRGRVYGLHLSRDVSETRCLEAATAYVKERPDTGPLSAWKFETFKISNS